MAPLPQSAAVNAKIMLIGDSKAGKTTALLSLVEAGYNLRILDMDNKLVGSYLHTRILETMPERMNQIDFLSYSDKYDSTGRPRNNTAKAYAEAHRTLTKWPEADGTFSNPATWGPEYVYVLDTLNLLSVAAFAQAQALAPDMRHQQLWYSAAQKAISPFISTLFAEDFNTNVVVMSHITEVALEHVIDSKGERATAPGSPVKSFPATTGQALSRHIAKNTNNLFSVESTRSGKRVIRTKSTAQMDLGAGLDLPETLPAETGLATIFAAIKGGKV